MARLGLLLATLSVNAAAAVSLSWPFSFYTTYKNSGSLAKQSADTYTVAIPQFPTQVSLAGLYSPITATFQCTGCGSGALDPCMSISSSAGTSSSCTQHICDDEPHACSDILPTSTASPSMYTITIADKNVLKGLAYTLTLATGCSDSTRALDKNVCSEVLANNYSTACAFGVVVTEASQSPPTHFLAGVFAAGVAVGNQTIFGIDGCDCIADPAIDGCSDCFDGTAPSQCEVSNLVQVCGPYCK